MKKVLFVFLLFIIVEDLPAQSNFRKDPAPQKNVFIAAYISGITGTTLYGLHQTGVVQRQDLGLTGKGCMLLCGALMVAGTADYITYRKEQKIRLYATPLSFSLSYRF